MIIIDDREITEHPDIPSRLGLAHKIERLDSGDYAFLDSANDPETIERCEVGNFVQKLRSGELESQLYRCQDAYVKVLLLIEGVYDSSSGLLTIHNKSERGYYRSYIYPSFSFKEAMAAEIRLSQMGIELIHSPNFDCTMEIIKTIYEQRTKPEAAHTLFKHIRSVQLPSKISSNPAVPRLLALCPRMSDTVAVRLLQRFGSILGILMASNRELLEVKGVGQTLVANLRKAVSE